MKLIKPIVRVGNSAGVILPREFLHGRARIEIIQKPVNIKRDIFEILDRYLYDILGIYLVGSRTRGEHSIDSDIDIVVVSKNTRKKISSGKYNIEIYPLDSIRKTLESDPITVYPRLIEAKPLLNTFLLNELINIEITKYSFKEFINACKRIIKINKEFINLDKIEKERFTSSKGIVYSLILRLRSIYLMKCILNKKKYLFTDFKNWLMNKASLKESEFNELYDIYKDTRDDKKIRKKTILIELAERLINFLDKEVNSYDKKRKEA